MKRILSIGKDDFYPQIFRLAVPIIIQNLLSAAVNSADVIMLNYVGQSGYFGGIPGSQLFQYFIYGVLWHRYRSLSFVLPICR